ncbi:Uncharacterized protein GBIM_02716 [Gryllus bimaculatus]|nr:Uncharacterized protein GBIM_02716 [Gryllus bimaculatus]
MLKGRVKQRREPRVRGVRRERAVDWGDYAKAVRGRRCGRRALAAARWPAGLWRWHALARRFKANARRAPPEPAVRRPSAAAFYVFGIFCQRGHDITPESLPCRVVYFTAYLTAVTLLAAYSAGLIAFLTVFERIKEVVRKRKAGGAAQQAKDPLLREVYRRLIAPGLADLPTDHAEVRRRLCAPGAPPYAYMRSRILGLSGAGYERCHVAAVPHVSFPEALATRLSLQELKQQGIHQRILLTFWPKMEPLDENPYSIVGLENVLPVLVILSIGVIMSGLLLLAEIVAYKIMQSHKLDYTDKTPEDQTEPEGDNRFSLSSATSVHERISSGSKDTPEQFHNSMVPIREEIVELPDEYEIGKRRLRHTVAASTLDTT